MAEKKGKEKTETGTKNGIFDLVMSRFQSVGLSEEKLKEITEKTERLKKLNAEIALLVKEREEIRNDIVDFMNSIDEQTKQLLGILGLIDIEEIRKAIGAEKVKRKGKRGRKIIVDGIEYSSAMNACEELGITVAGDSAVRRLISWAFDNGHRIIFDDIEMQVDSKTELYEMLGDVKSIKIFTT